MKLGIRDFMVKGEYLDDYQLNIRIPLIGKEKFQ